MTAAEWADLKVAGAFVAGAVLATLAVLRVVRALTTMFGAEMRRRPPPRDRDEHP